MQKLLCTQDITCTWVIAIIWWMTDVAVIVSLKNTALEYLTNQVWLFGLITRLALMFKMQSKYSQEEGAGKTFSFTEWLAVFMFVLYGSLLYGVLLAFFVLIMLDSALLDKFQRTDEHTIGEIVLWNHIRHVTPVILHLATMAALRKVISTCIIKHPPRISENRHFNRRWVAFALMTVPLISGIVHHFVFDDKKLYQYGDEDIGNTCQLAFAASSLLGSVYLLYGIIGDDYTVNYTLAPAYTVLACNDNKKKDTEMHTANQVSFQLLTQGQMKPSAL